MAAESDPVSMQNELGKPSEKKQEFLGVFPNMGGGVSLMLMLEHDLYSWDNHHTNGFQCGLFCMDTGE